MSATADHPSAMSRELFERILCLTDLSPGGEEAVRQAAALARPGAAIDLMTVAPIRPPGMPRPQAAQIEALVAGSELAAARAVTCTPHIVEAEDEPTAVLESWADHDLVVIPAGGSAAGVLACTPGSLLLARTPPAGSPFAESILAAVDGSPESHAAARLAARLAVRQHAVVTLVATPEHDVSHQHALERDIQTVERITGKRPLVLDEHRGAVPSILYAAASIEASVIVMGRRPGHPGRSVSAQVAKAAPCSVLVVRGG
jgi:nucleotide-binding universal stress UspA family protein